MEYKDYKPISDSYTLNQAFRSLDEDIQNLELDNFELRKKNRELEKELSDNLNERLKECNKSVANTLIAALSVPGYDAFTPASAVVLQKIRHMKDIKEIHKYIDSIGEKVLKETKGKK
jgi:hypothetical protein